MGINSIDSSVGPRNTKSTLGDSAVGEESYAQCEGEFYSHVRTGSYFAQGSSSLVVVQKVAWLFVTNNHTCFC